MFQSTQMVAVTSNSANNRLRCTECRRRKRKCTGTSTICDYCQKHGKLCSFDAIVTTHQVKSHPSASATPKLPKEVRQPLTKQLLVEHIRTHNPHPMKYGPLSLGFRVNSSVFLPSTILVTEQQEMMLFDGIQERGLQSKAKVGDHSLMSFSLSALRVEKIDKPYTTDHHLTVDDIRAVLQITQEQSLLQSINKTFTFKDHEDIPIASSFEAPKYDSLDTVIFTINYDALLNDFGVEPVGYNPFTKTYTTGLPPDVSQSLFTRFCRETDPQILDILLPVVIGSSLTIRAAFLVTHYSHRSLLDSIDSFHLSVLQSLQARLWECSSMGCDHTLSAVLFLLDVEVLRGMTDGLYHKLLRLARIMINSRGGVSSLSKSITGKTLLVLLARHLCAGLSHPLEDAIDADDLIPFSDFVSVVSLDHSWIGDQKLTIIGVFGHVTHLSHLMRIATGVKTPNQESNIVLMVQVVEQGEQLEAEIQKLMKASNSTDSFLLRCALLYLAISVFGMCRTSPRIVAYCHVLKSETDALLAHIDSKFTPVLPLFIFGFCLITEDDQMWLKRKLSLLLELTSKQVLRTCLEALEDMWKLNDAEANDKSIPITPELLMNIPLWC